MLHHRSECYKATLPSANRKDKDLLRKTKITICLSIRQIVIFFL